MARRPRPPNARKRPRHKPQAGPSAAGSSLPPLPARFLTSAPDIASAPPDAGREVAFAGRSNAGKSSALNRLTGRRGLARTSRTPGRTQLLNFFEVAPHARLVDLPGYGYARADQATRRGWQEHVEGYLSARQSLVGLVLVMDVRHPFQPFDEAVLEWSAATAMPLLILLNKADKLGHGAIGTAARHARERLAAVPSAQVLPFSALRGTGSEQALTLLREWLDLAEDAAASATHPAGEDQPRVGEKQDEQEPGR